MNSTPPNRPVQKGFSLPEMMVTIAVVGILAALAMASYSNVSESAQKTVHAKLVAQLNGAVKGYGMGNRDITTLPKEAATDDEFEVLAKLQDKPSPSSGEFSAGAPYFDQRFHPQASSASTDYRARWGGYSFELLEPGRTGTGLRLSNDGSDFHAP